MVFNLAIAAIVTATFAAAANYKRVSCPDGVNTATNEAVCPYYSPKKLMTEYV